MVFPLGSSNSIHGLNVGNHSEAKEQDNHQHNGGYYTHPDWYGEERCTVPYIIAKVRSSVVVVGLILKGVKSINWAATWENRIFAYAKTKTQISFPEADHFGEADQRLCFRYNG